MYQYYLNIDFKIYWYLNMKNRIYQRNILKYAIDLMGEFPILAILGARQVGKTSLSKMLAADFQYFDL